MAKTNKGKQCYTKHIEERQTIPWPKPTRTNNGIQSLCITLFVLVALSHGIVWRSSMCFVFHCLSLLVLAMVLSDVLRCVLYNIVTSDNSMDKTNKDKQCNTKHIEECQTIPWPKPTGQTMLYKTQLVLAMVLSDVLRCVLYTIVCPCWFWPWYCLTFFDVFCITLQCYTKHIEERQTIPWTKPTRTNNVIQNTSKNVRQYHGQNAQGQTMLYKTRYCLTFFDVLCITLFILVGFGHGSVWRSSMCFV
jgi:hypothetical protein